MHLRTVVEETLNFLFSHFRKGSLVAPHAAFGKNISHNVFYELKCTSVYRCFRLPARLILAYVSVLKT